MNFKTELKFMTYNELMNKLNKTKNVEEKKLIEQEIAIRFGNK